MHFCGIRASIPGYSTDIGMGTYVDIADDGVVFDAEFDYGSSVDHGAYENSTGFTGGKYKDLGGPTESSSSHIL